MICIGALVGIAAGLLIALQVTSTKNGTERLKKYSEQLHNMSMGTIWNTPLVSLPEANSRAIPPADLNWIKKVETLQAFRGLRKEDYGVVIPEYIQQQQEGKGEGEKGGEGGEGLKSEDGKDNNNKCIPLAEQPTEFMFHAQDGQDQLVNYVLEGKNFGFFVEFGAGDGSFHSNTKFFEQQRCWIGICIEPSKHIFERLVENRPKCIAVHGGLCSQDGNIEKEFTDVLSPTGWTGWSGFADTFTDYHKQQIQEKVEKDNWTTETYKVKCHTLKSLIEMTSKYRKNITS